MRIKTLARTTLVAALCGSVLLGVASPAAAAAPRSAVSASASAGSLTVTSSELDDLVKRARAAGADTSRLEDLRGGSTLRLNAASDLTKTLLVYALRHGGVLLSRIVSSVDAEAGRQILLYSDALADLIEHSAGLDRATIVGFLVGLGVSARVAGVIADVLLRFLS
jgi:hypothetical protein